MARAWRDPPVARLLVGWAAMKRILVCLDASPRAATVLDAAHAISSRTGAKLVVFRSVGLPPEVDKEFLALSPNDVMTQLVSRARADLEKLCGPVAKGDVEQILVHVGVAWDAICAAAREIDADMIVIGSHGYHGLDKILGTTAGKVVNHADRSVLVVREKPTA